MDALNDLDSNPQWIDGLATIMKKTRTTKMLPYYRNITLKGSESGSPGFLALCQISFHFLDWVLPHKKGVTPETDIEGLTEGLPSRHGGGVYKENPIAIKR